MNFVVIRIVVQFNGKNAKLYKMCHEKEARFVLNENIDNTEWNNCFCRETIQS